MQYSSFGKLYVLLSSLLLSLSTVIAHLLVADLNPLLIVFYTFGIAFVVTNVLSLNNKMLVSTVIKHWKLLFLINISTAIDWTFIFFALKYVSPSLVNCFVFGIAPLATLLLSISLYNSKKLLAIDLSVCLTICLILLALSIFYYNNNVYPTTLKNLCLGVIMSCMSGFATGVTAYSCKLLSSKGIKISIVLKTRFIFIIVITFALLLGYKINLYIPTISLLSLVGLSFAFILIPAYLLQKGIEYISPVTAVVISSLIPVMTYFSQFIEPEFSIKINELILMTLLSITICCSIFLTKSTKDK